MRDDDSLTVLGGTAGQFEVANTFAAMDPADAFQSLARLAVVHPQLDRSAVYSTARADRRVTGPAERPLLSAPFGIFQEASA